MKNFSDSHEEKHKHYSDEVKKVSKKRMIRMEKAADFFAGGRKNAEKNGKRNRKIYRKARKKHKKYPDCEEKHAWKLI